jgi:VIT1/CCC1 family predicted Fe2+/Mn2+ transporter
MAVREEDLDSVMAGFANNDEAILEAMAALEFGLVERERRSPFKAMAMSGVLFLAGSAPSVVPFAVFSDAGIALVWASILSLAGLFVVGVVKARVANTHWFWPGVENTLIAGVGGVIAWAVGNAVGTSLS